MCIGCWDEYESPQIFNPQVAAAVELLPHIDEFGPLHIIVEDWNLEDENLAFCRTKAGELSPDEDRLLTLFEGMSLDERASAMGLYDGFWKQGEV